MGTFIAKTHDNTRSLDVTGNARRPAVFDLWAGGVSVTLHIDPQTAVLIATEAAKNGHAVIVAAEVGPNVYRAQRENTPAVSS